MFTFIIYDKPRHCLRVAVSMYLVSGPTVTLVTEYTDSCIAHTHNVLNSQQV